MVIQSTKITTIPDNFKKTNQFFSLFICFSDMDKNSRHAGFGPRHDVNLKMKQVYINHQSLSFSLEPAPVPLYLLWAALNL